MSRRKTHEEYIVELAIKNPMVEAIDRYIDKKTPILHHCLIHDVYWMASPTNILAGKGCNKCMREKISNALVKSHEKYVSDLIVKNPIVEVIDKYINSNTPIMHHCLKHDIYWKASPNNILLGEGCVECRKEKHRKTLSKSHEQYVNEVALVNPNIEVIGKYINAYTTILHRCKIDGEEWFASPTNILMGKGCPLCSESKGEKSIRLWLDAHNVLYVCLKMFDNCKNARVLPFDFYLPEYNICIEYDGEQHFKPIDFANKGEEWANEQFNIRQKCDAIKTEYCKNNNIALLRIPYFKNIEEELNNFLFI